MNEGNLKHFGPGNCANPKGRGKGVLNAKTILKKFLSGQTLIVDPETGEKTKGTFYDSMVLNLIKAALTSEDPVKAFNAIVDRIEGKVTDKLKVKADVNNVERLVLEDTPNDKKALESEENIEINNPE